MKTSFKVVRPVHPGLAIDVALAILKAQETGLSAERVIFAKDAMLSLQEYRFVGYMSSVDPHLIVDEHDRNIDTIIPGDSFIK